MNILKQLTVVILLGLTTLAASGRLIVLTDYWLNTDYYTATYCVNKANVALNCQAKCHLKKQLQKEEDRSSEPMAFDANKEFYWHIDISESKGVAIEHSSLLQYPPICFIDLKQPKYLLRPPQQV